MMVTSNKMNEMNTKKQYHEMAIGFFCGFLVDYRT
jgi:hypothetical protein